MRLKQLLVLAALPLATACLKGACEQSGVWGIQMQVIDQTGNAQADSAFAVLTDVSFKDTMRINGFDNNGIPLVLAGARDRAGVYNLCMHKAGFEDFARNNIVVANTACGIAPVVFSATLVPRPVPDTSTVCVS